MPRLTAALLVALGLSLTTAPVMAQTRQMAQAVEVGPLQTRRGVQFPAELDQQRAQDTREEFRRVMELYPPALGQILKLDPTLMTNTAYLTPYPALTTYLQRHPEVPRYSGYFLSYVGGSNSYEPQSPETELRREAIGMWRNTIESAMVFAGFLTVVLTITWLIRYIVGHRRWLRATKIQSEVHGRLMERFSANDELLAYVQSPAGRQFLQATPVMVDATSSPSMTNMAAPFGRILLSIQAGLVLGCGGAGLLIVKQYVIDEVAQMLLLFGVLGVAVGVGFALAAGASFMLSLRLGLFDAARQNGANGA